MITRMLETKGSANRGSALLIVSYFAVLLSGVVGVYFYQSSLAASREAQVQESAAAAQAVAEYGAELAISNLYDVKYVVNAETGKRTSVSADWVGRDSYGPAPSAASSERRITGEMNGYTYQVVVRAVREAKKRNDALPESWLSSVNPPNYEYGVAPVSDFTNAYEIISTAARTENAKAAAGAGKFNTLLPGEGVVRTVVNMAFNDPGDLTEDLATLHIPKPGRNGYTSTVPRFRSGASYLTDNLLQGLLATRTNVSGEDHYGVRTARQEQGAQLVIEGLVNIPAIPSQLYSVSNNYWSAGAMTLQYQLGEDVYNPIIPRMGTFGTAAIYRQMVPRDDSLEIQDQYVFGGKQARTAFSIYTPATDANLVYDYGRSVHLLEDGTIKETTEAEATPEEFAESSLAVGKFENVLKLYLNYATATKPSNGSPPNAPHPAVTASNAAVTNWKNQWRQMSMGYYSKARTINRSQVANKMPLDNAYSTAKRRWALKLWVKNEEGQFLAREYTYGSSGSPVVPPATWYGRYRWYDYKGYVNSHGNRFHQGSMPGKTVKLAIHTRFLTLEELLGYRLVKDSMGIPAKLTAAAKARYGDNVPEYVSDSEIVAGVPDYVLVNGEKVAFEVNGSVFDEAPNRVISGDNYGVTASTLRSFPEADGLYVYNDATRTYDRKVSLHDFAFKRNIADTSKGEAEDIREMVTLHMVIEDSPEDTSSSAETLYFDMGLTVTVVYPKDTGGDITIGDNALRDIFRHWWEGGRIQTLTGQRAGAALSSTPSDEVLALEEREEQLLGLYKELGFYYRYDENRVIPGLTTMVESSSRNYGRFNRAVFDPDTGVLASNATQNSLDPVYYYGDDDIAQFQQIFATYFNNIDNFPLTDEEMDLVIVDGEVNNELYMEMVDAKKKAAALEMMADKNPGKTFEPLENRFSNGRVESLASINELESLLVCENLITPRSITSELFGFQNSRLPAVYAQWQDLGTDSPTLRRMTQRDLNPASDSTALLPITKKNASFLPGELNAWEGADSVVPITEKPGNTEPGHIPMQVTDTGLTQPNGRPVEPKFVWHADDAASLEPGEITVNDIHNEPVPDILSPAEMEKLKSLYPREHRGQLGWHRMGPTPTMPETTSWPDEETYRRVNGDNYEFVIMSKKGFNPYYAMDASGKTYLAAIKPLSSVTSSDQVYVNDCDPMIMDGSDLPTFVIEGEEVDGAGVLYINGNLEVNTVFAYHGLLLVAGDITVKPGKYNVRDADGNVIDAEGNVLFEDGSGQWYYMDERGNRQTGHPKVEWRGKLIVQGKVVAGGDITATDGVVEHDILTQPAGVIDLRGSEGAIADTVGLLMEAAPNQRFVTERLGWTSGGGSSQYELWK